ncbi:MAG: sulfurtransferase [Planifilum sp.]
MLPSAVVSPKWLRERLGDSNLVIVDCRFELSKPHAGRKAYERDHIPGAVYMDLERDLSGPVRRHGGRHPLPELEALANTLGRVGIDRTKTVVAYDDQGGAMAARLWWLLRYLGHDQVAVLDEGYRGWKEKGYPVTPDRVHPKPSRFTPQIRNPEWLVGMEEVRRHRGLLIDSRDPERFAGRYEPIDAKAGHIPGAVNYFWKNNLEEGRRWKTPQALKKDFSFIPEEEQPIVYCGSGVTACANLLALHLAGREGRLYAGSFSDWISYEENPIAQGESIP